MALIPTNVENFASVSALPHHIRHYLKASTQKGCNVQQAYTFNLKADAAAINAVAPTFTVVYNYDIFVCCEAGVNRCQMSRSVIKKHVSKDMRNRVRNPHGCFAGLDAFVNEIDSVDVYGFPFKGAYRYSRLPEARSEGDLFYELMGHDRVPRLLENRLTSKLDPSAYSSEFKPRFEEAFHARTKLRFMFDDILDEAIINGSVFFVFNQALHVLLYRLLERSDAIKHNLNKVFVYPLDSEDPIVKGDINQARNFVRIFEDALIIESDVDSYASLPANVFAGKI